MAAMNFLPLVIFEIGSRFVVIPALLSNGLWIMLLIAGIFGFLEDVFKA